MANIKLNKLNFCSLLYLFIKAARDGKRDLVERRLEMLGKGNKKINKKDQENTTALHYAVRYNHLHIVKLLLDYGAGKEKVEQLITSWTPWCVYTVYVL